MLHHISNPSCNGGVGFDTLGSQKRWPLDMHIHSRSDLAMCCTKFQTSSFKLPLATHLHNHTPRNLCTNTHKHIKDNTHKCKHTHTHATQTHTYTHTHTHTRTHTHTHTHKHTHTHTHTYTHTHTHMHTHTLQKRLRLSFEKDTRTVINGRGEFLRRGKWCGVGHGRGRSRGGRDELSALMKHLQYLVLKRLLCFA